MPLQNQIYILFPDNAAFHDVLFVYGVPHADFWLITFYACALALNRLDLIVDNIAHSPRAEYGRSRSRLLNQQSLFMCMVFAFMPPHFLLSVINGSIGACFVQMYFLMTQFMQKAFEVFLSGSHSISVFKAHFRE